MYIGEKTLCKVGARIRLCGETFFGADQKNFVGSKNKIERDLWLASSYGRRT